MTAGDPSSWAALPLTLLVPEGVSGTIEIYEQHAELKIAVVERSRAHLVGDEWGALSTTGELVDRPYYIREDY